MGLPPSVITSCDRAIFVAINHHLRSPLLDVAMPRISDLGLGHVQALALVIVAAVRGREQLSETTEGIWSRVKAAFRSQRRWLAPLVLALVISGIGANVIKQTVHRDRPTWFYASDPVGRTLNVTVLKVATREPLMYHGFLSGHAATTAAIATAATVVLWRRRRTFLISGLWILTMAIGFSRIYLADHWPLDVVAGFALGALSGIAAARICARKSSLTDVNDEQRAPESTSAVERARGSA